MSEKSKTFNDVDETKLEATPGVSQKKFNGFRDLLLKWFQTFTGHNSECISSFNSFIKFMHTPTDAAALGVGRMLFGLCMLIDIPDERGGGELDLKWGEPRDCRFPLFPFLAPLNLAKMAIVYGVMYCGAIGIFLGYRFKISSLMFIVTYWYIFLLDKSVWNNHSYLYGLLGVLFAVTSANRYCSVDAWLDPTMKPEVPFWNYFLLKFQFFLLYFYAGVKKLCPEWLSGYAMTNLSYHWVFTPFRLVLGPYLTDLLIVHWFACFFDLTIAFFLIYEPLRVWATPFCVSFHLMNSRLFRIGMFPWTCLAELPLFYHVDWPRKVLAKCQKFFGYKSAAVEKQENAKKKIFTVEEVVDDLQDLCGPCKFKQKQRKMYKKQRKTVLLIFAYMILQLFLPFSHFITKGYNGWTEGLYGYSWDMMVNAWDTVLISIRVVDNSNGKHLYLEPYAYAESDRWTKHPDMAYQYAQCINQRLQEDFRARRNLLLNSSDISIYFDIWTSMNGRFQQRFYNPYQDMVKAKWSPFAKTDWVLPIITEMTSMRPEMKRIEQSVLGWSNFTDLLFIADFPGFHMEHYMPRELDNVTLTVLQGAVKHEQEHSSKVSIITKGKSIPLKTEIFHKIQVISKTPSSYIFTFVNQTMAKMAETGTPDEFSEVKVEKPMLPLWTELKARLMDFRRFLIHVGNGLLFELYGVPMPRRVREIGNDYAEK
ncbi:vitamin K-dependent gamma-carboxylase [Culicoides brevitarsis]|uniref:vitamin K-dependent gamma-carboxylase n=1 Tax=Culicoides brevitarsis TaxID=469753 RepID=UPI00307BED98